MASKSKPTAADLPAPLPRAIRANNVLRVANGHGLVRAGRGADRVARRLGVAASRQHDADPAGRVTLPHGVWPRTADDDAADADAAVLRTLEPALAMYATTLRARRGPRQEPSRRGLPLVVRRGGATAAGEARGPGGLAGASVPTDHDAPAIDLVRTGRPASDAAQNPLARRATPTPAAPSGAPRPTTAERRPSIQLRPRRRGPS